MTYLWDRLERNEVHASERDEGRSSRHGVSESERADACGHSTRNRKAQCYDCDDHADDDRNDE